jgi:hypothetical protein
MTFAMVVAGSPVELAGSGWLRRAVVHRVADSGEEHGDFSTTIDDSAIESGLEAR